MNHKTALGISLLLHPIWVPVVATLFFMGWCSESILVTSTKARLYVVLFVSLFSVFLPLASLFFLKQSNAIADYHLRNRKDRPLPLLSAAIYMGSMAYLFATSLKVSYLLTAAAIVTCFTLLMLAIVSLYFQISIHSCAMGGLVGMLGGIQFFYPSYKLLLPVAIALFMLGLVSTARLAQGAHSLGEISIGSLMGIVINFIGVFWVLALIT